MPSKELEEDKTGKKGSSLIWNDKKKKNKPKLVIKKTKVKKRSLFSHSLSLNFPGMFYLEAGTLAQTGKDVKLIQSTKMRKF